MKILIVLLCLLCISCTASAVLSLEIINAHTIGINCDNIPAYANPMGYSAYILWSQAIDPYLIEDGLTPAGTGDLSLIEDGGIVDFRNEPDLPGIGIARLKEVAIFSTIENQLKPGIHYTAAFSIFGFSYNDAGFGRIDLLDQDWVLQNTLYVLPEPATLVLLTLGGIFIRKR